MSDTQRRVDAIRRRSGEVENHLIDEYRAGKISRREFVRRRAASIGMSLPARRVPRGRLRREPRGSRGQADPPQTGKPSRAARSAPALTALPARSTRSPSPTRAASRRSARRASTWSGRTASCKPQPRLAESWEPNEDGSVWTFKIRQGVKFHDGTPLTAEDVAATFNRLADPDERVQRPFGVQRACSPRAARKALDAHHRRVPARRPERQLPVPHLLGQLQRDHPPRGLRRRLGEDVHRDRPVEARPVHARTWGVTFVRNDRVLGHGAPTADREAEVIFYSNEQGLVLGLQGNAGRLRRCSSPSPAARRCSPTRASSRSSCRPPRTARSTCARDSEPFTRQARPPGHRAARQPRRARRRPPRHEVRHRQRQPVRARLPVDRTRPRQRQQDVAEAKQLLAAAGSGGRLRRQLSTWNGFEMPDLAQLLQENLRRGRDPHPAQHHRRRDVLRRRRLRQFAAGSTRRWASPSTATAACPTCCSVRRCSSDGTWNGAHFKNPTYDELVRDYTAALDPEAQRARPKEIQELLLDEVPILFTYFYFFLSGAKDYIAGVDTTAMGHADLSQAGLGGVAAMATLHHQADPAQPRHAVPPEHHRVRQLPGASGQRRPQHPRPARRPGGPSTR